ncbi:MAG: EamA family transporter [Fusobacterium sp.]|nr:EamA family transporter [Fusobacterium sp.]
MREARARLMLILSTFIFGTVGLIVNYIDLPSSIISAGRGFIGMLSLIVIIILKKKKISFKNIRKNFKNLFLSGLFIGINWIFIFEAYKYSSVATATLILYLAPIFMILASPFVLKEKLSIRKIICSFIALLGMIFISGFLDSKGVSRNEIRGIILALFAAIFYACVIFFNKSLKRISSFDMTIVQLGVAALVSFPYALIVDNLSELEFNFKSVILLIYIGVINTGITYAMYFNSVRHLKAQTVAIFSYVDPVVAVILSALILKEEVTVFTIIGAILILGSTLVSELLDKSEL